MSSLKTIVDEIEDIEAKIADLNADKSKAYKSAKSDGYDLPALRLVISERRKRAKDSAAYETLTGIAEAYRDELERGTHRALTRARTRPAIEHDPATGEITPSPAGGESSDAGLSPHSAAALPNAVPAGDPATSTADVAVRATAEKVAEPIGPQTIKMIAAIADNPVSDDVARIAIQTAQLLDSGRLTDADAIVRVVHAAADAGPLPRFLDRRQGARP